MLQLLIKKFIKDPENTKDPSVRSAYGTLCGAYGIFLNFLLFLGKIFAGTISGSVAITADAFNNLSDAGSSVITLLGFKLASKKADPKHPFGFGRIEYFTGLILSMLIVLIGVELGKSSIQKIITPEPITPGLLPAIILAVSILVKFYMSRYNKKIGEKINSAAMQATATDSLSDSVSTLVVLISMILAWLFKINIDAYAGLAVAVFICYAGFNSAKETISPLLGEAPDPELVESIAETVEAHDEIKGIHDLIVHDYGPGRTYISLHAEVDGHGDFFDAHDAIDRIEVELRNKYNCLATIHLDPIDTSNSELAELRAGIQSKIQEQIDPSMHIHDLRVVPGSTHTNVIFDAVVPTGFKLTDDEVIEKIKKIVADNYPQHLCVISIDKSYI